MTEDLGVKIGTKEEARWTKVLETAREAIGNCLMEEEINKEIVKLAKRKLEKFK